MVDADTADAAAGAARMQECDEPPASAAHRTARVKAHVETLLGQLERIISDGVAQGMFDVADPTAAARAVFDATTRFHNPVHAPEWSDRGIEAAYERVRALALNGLTGQR